MSGRGQREGGWTGNRGAPEAWDEFDALPLGLKRVFWNAPYPYTARTAVQATRRGGDLRRFARLCLDRMTEDVRRESQRLYGQAQEGWL